MIAPFVVSVPAAFVSAALVGIAIDRGAEMIVVGRRVHGVMDRITGEPHDAVALGRALGGAAA